MIEWFLLITNKVTIFFNNLFHIINQFQTIAYKRKASLSKFQYNETPRPLRTTYYNLTKSKFIRDERSTVQAVYNWVTACFIMMRASRAPGKSSRDLDNIYPKNVYRERQQLYPWTIRSRISCIPISCNPT